MNIQVNYLAIIIACVVSMAAGFLWYSPITAYVLSHVMTLSENFFHYSKPSTGLTTAFWMWLGFMMPVQLTNTIFGDKKWKLFAINTGYQLVSLLLMGAIFGFIS